MQEERETEREEGKKLLSPPSSVTLNYEDSDGKQRQLMKVNKSSTYLLWVCRVGEREERMKSYVMLQ